jgi:protease I
MPRACVRGRAVAANTVARRAEDAGTCAARIIGMSKIALLIDQDFEDSEFRVPYDRLRAGGHEVDIIGIEANSEVAGKRGNEKVTIEHAVRDVAAKEYDALVIPGGYSPDHLRMNRDAVRFTREMADLSKPVAAVCHGPSLLIEADLVDDRKVTSWPSVRTDLVNAGARWIDREVVVDGNLITSRKPDDLAAFSDAILNQLAHGVPKRTESRTVH